MYHGQAAYPAAVLPNGRGVSAHHSLVFFVSHILQSHTSPSFYFHLRLLYWHTTSRWYMCLAHPMLQLPRLQHVLPFAAEGITHGRTSHTRMFPTATVVPATYIIITVAATGTHGRRGNHPQTLFRGPTYGQKTTPLGKRGEIA